MKNIKLFFYFLLIIFNIYFFNKVVFAIDKIDFLKINKISSLFNSQTDFFEIYIEFNHPIINQIEFGKKLIEYDNKFIEKFIKIDPDLKCNWQWKDLNLIMCNVSQKNLVFDDKRYKVIINKNFRSFNGYKLESEYISEFIIKEKKIFFSDLIEWKDKNTPFFKIIFSDFVDKKTLNQIYLINRNTKEKFYLKIVENFFKYIDPYEFHSDENLFRKNFNLKNYNFHDYYKRIILEPISILGYEQDFDLVFEGQGLLELEILHSFKTPSKHPEFLGIKCINADNFKLTYLSVNDLNTDNSNVNCLPFPYENKLIFSSFFDSNDLNKYLKFNSKIDFLNHSKKSYEIPIKTEPNINYNISYNKSEAKNILSNIKNNDKSLKDYFGDDLKEDFNFNFKTANDSASFDIKDQKTIFINNYNQFLNNSLVFKAKNIKNLIINYNLIKNDFLLKNQTYKYLLSNELNNSFHTSEMDLNQINNSDFSIIYGNIIANPTEQKYQPIEYKFFAQNTKYDIFAQFYNNRFIVWVNDLSNNYPVTNATINLKKIQLSKAVDYFSGEDIFIGITNENGFFIKNDFNIDFSKYINNDIFNDIVYVLEIKKNKQITWIFLNKDFLISGAQDIEKTDLSKPYKSIINIEEKDNQYEILYKIYNLGLKDHEYNLIISDPDSKIIYTKDKIVFSNFNIFDDKFSVLKNSKCGIYKIFLQKHDSKNFLLNDSLIIDQFEISCTQKFSINLKNEKQSEYIIADDAFNLIIHNDNYAESNNINIPINITIDLNDKNNLLSDDLNFIFTDQTDYVSSLKSQRIFASDIKTDDKGNFDKSFNINNSKIIQGEVIAKLEYDKEIIYSNPIKYFANNDLIGIDKKLVYVMNEDLDPQINFIVKSLQNKKNIDMDVVILIEKLNHQNQWIRKQTIIKKVENYLMKSFSLGKKESGIYRIVMFDKNAKQKYVTSKKIFIINSEDYQSAKILEHLENSEDLIDLNKISSNENIIKFDLINPFFSKNSHSQALICLNSDKNSFCQVKKISNIIENIEIKNEDGFPFSNAELNIIITNLNKNQLKPQTRIIQKKIFIDSNERKDLVKIDIEKLVYWPGEKMNVSLKLNLDNNEEDLQLDCILDIYENIFNKYKNFVKNFENGFISGEKLFFHLFKLDKNFIKNNNLFDNSNNINKYYSSLYYNPSIILDAKLKKENVVEINLPDKNGKWNIDTLCYQPKTKQFINISKTVETFKEVEISTGSIERIFIGEKIELPIDIINYSDEEKNLEFYLKDSKDLNLEKISILDVQEKNYITNNISSFVLKGGATRKFILSLELKEGKLLDSQFIELGLCVNEKNLNLAKSKNMLKNLIIHLDSLVIKDIFVQESLIAKEQNKLNIAISDNIDVNLSSININISDHIIDNIENHLSFLKNINLLNDISVLNKKLGCAIYLNIKNHKEKNFDNFLWEDCLLKKDYALEIIKNIFLQHNENDFIINKKLHAIGIINQIQEIESNYFDNSIWNLIFQESQNYVDINSINTIDSKIDLIYLLSKNKIKYSQQQDLLFHLTEIINIHWSKISLNRQWKILISVLRLQKESEIFNVIFKSAWEKYLNYENNKDNQEKNIKFLLFEFLNLVIKYQIKLGDYSLEELRKIIVDNLFKEKILINEIPVEIYGQYLYDLFIYGFYEKNKILNNNQQINFSIQSSQDNKIFLDEIIEVPNYIEIENLNQFVNKDIEFIFSKNDLFQSENENILYNSYLSIKYNFFNKIKFNNQRELILPQEYKKSIEISKKYLDINSNLIFKDKSQLSIHENQIFDVVINLDVREKQGPVYIKDLIPSFLEYIDFIEGNDTLKNIEKRYDKNKHSIEIYCKDLNIGKYKIIVRLKFNNANGEFFIPPTQIRGWNNKIIALSNGYDLIKIKSIK